MALRTITSANSSLVLSIPEVLGAPVPLQGYAVDAAFAVEPFDTAEAIMGVDGIMSAGYTPQPKKMTISLQADSASLEVFNQWLGAMEQAREVFFCDLTVNMPAIGKTFSCTKGVLTNTPKMPEGKKTLQPVTYTITFQDIQPSVLTN